MIFHFLKKPSTARLEYITNGKIPKVKKEPTIIIGKKNYGTLKIKLVKSKDRLWEVITVNLSDFWGWLLDNWALTLVYVIIFAALLILSISIYESSKKETATDIISNMLGYGIKKQAEKAYFEGQRDALTGDIRIKSVDSVWVWIKSPWDNGTKPEFIPDLKK